MSGRKLAGAEYQALKTAFRALAKACGGLEAAAMETRVGDTQLQRYQSPHEPEAFAPVDVIADLEREAGRPVVTRALARLAGHVLFPLPPAAGSGPWVVRLAAVAQEAGEALAGLGQALADDGEITGDEARRLGLRRLCADAIEALAEVDHALAQVEDRR